MGSSGEFQKLGGSGQCLHMQRTQHRSKGCTCTALLISFNPKLEDPHLYCTSSSKSKISPGEYKGDAVHTLTNIDLKLKLLLHVYLLMDGQIVMTDIFLLARSLTDKSDML